MIKMKTVEIAVGALIIAGVASLLLLALQVSGLSHLFTADSGYKVYAHFENIGGLKVRAKVSVGGVVIGRVAAIQLDPKDYTAKVTMVLEKGRCDPFPADSQASIMTAGLLGDNYIGLVPGFNDEEHLIEGSNIPIENTHSALILEKLISRFLANQVSEDKASSNVGINARTGVITEENHEKETTGDAVKSMDKTPLKVDENLKPENKPLPTPALEKQIEH